MMLLSYGIMILCHYKRYFTMHIRIQQLFGREGGLSRLVSTLESQNPITINLIKIRCLIRSHTRYTNEYQTFEYHLFTNKMIKLFLPFFAHLKRTLFKTGGETPWYM